ncbi:uncharacterized protein cubi_03012 [Cryptosporidium ubiquitum]|uniref:Uncharacterized protein n=1 Tax=Cryptosporidium ubiquitum TaxID=857276 RepID=A0A1J4MKY9_9CRYT|nr:uncharacterized protein cubi_03012 [Cryptosporidium ubiquitum]OII74880.1 hypothetical protein cubi_03012 [Cryptosporidium ubiquitum]
MTKKTPALSNNTMEFKYIAVCVILYLICVTVEANSIHHRIKLDSFVEYDIFDIIVNSRKADAKPRRNFPFIKINNRQSSNSLAPAFMKIHHGACKEGKNEYTVSTSSSPAFENCNHSLANQIEVNSTGSISVKCCSTITSPNIIPQINVTQTIDLIN